MFLEPYLIEHCSPTLAALKTANLFSCKIESAEALQASLALWNAMLAEKGIELILLKQERRMALIYVCRKAKLAEDLAQAGVAEFLQQYGYRQTDVSYAIQKLQQRLATSPEFPHEIGLFLDYPLGDVRGFIENAGANCKCTGCWKVYCNVCDTAKRFCKFEKCREVYMRLWKSGVRDVMQMTVPTA